jgi:hypothetical protein
MTAAQALAIAAAALVFADPPILSRAYDGASALAARAEAEATLAFTHAAPQLAVLSDIRCVRAERARL